MVTSAPLLVICCLTLLFPSATAVSADASATCSATRCLTAGPYDYEPLSPRGPTHWASTMHGASLCATGTRQSPVDVAVQYASTPNSTRAPIVRARRCVLDFHPTQHNFKFAVAREFGACGSVTLSDGDTLPLAQVHLHSPSEHRLAGVQYPLELHFVHKAPASGRLAVVGVLVELGAHNAELQRFLDAARGRAAAVVRLERLLKMAADADVCSWMGSLTTPPCKEGVSWVIALRSVEASLAQIGEYRAMMGEKTNNRPMQARNGREIVCFARKREVLPGFM